MTTAIKSFVELQPDGSLDYHWDGRWYDLATLQKLSRDGFAGIIEYEVKPGVPVTREEEIKERIQKMARRLIELGG